MLNDSSTLKADKKFNIRGDGNRWTVGLKKKKKHVGISKVNESFMTKNGRQVFCKYTAKRITKQS